MCLGADTSGAARSGAHSVAEQREDHAALPSHPEDCNLRTMLAIFCVPFLTGVVLQLLPAFRLRKKILGGRFGRSSTLITNEKSALSGVV
jgi:hypothetical protein